MSRRVSEFTVMTFNVPTTSVVSFRQFKIHTWGLYQRILCRTGEQNVKISILRSPQILFQADFETSVRNICGWFGVFVWTRAESEYKHEHQSESPRWLSAHICRATQPQSSIPLAKYWKKGSEVFLSLWNWITSADWILKSSFQLDLFYLLAVVEHSQHYRWNYVWWRRSRHNHLLLTAVTFQRRVCCEVAVITVISDRRLHVSALTQG